MALIKLLVLDDDEEYCYNLCNHLTHNYSETFIINCFSGAYSIQEWIEKTDPDLILASELYYKQVFSSFKKNIIVLSSGKNTADLHDKDTIYKYKDVNQIAGDIINLFTKTGNIIRKAKEKTPKIIAVYSASGNVGKTTVSLGISSICSYSGLSVFYLNLEQFQSTNILFSNNNEYSLTDIIYFAKDKDKNLPSKIPIMSCKDVATNLNYFNVPNNVFESDELTPQDTRFMINSIKDCGQYDLIVIDMDSQLNQRSLNLFELADEILYVLNDNEICLHKTKLFNESIALLSNNNEKNTFLPHKFIYVANKVSKQALQSNKSFQSFKITSSIPLQQEFTSLSNLVRVTGGPEIFYSVFKELARRYI